MTQQLFGTLTEWKKRKYGISTKWLSAITFILLTTSISGQEVNKIPALFQNSHFSGELQTDMQYCFPVPMGDSSEYAKQFLSNSYLDLRYTSRMLNAGIRAEAYENPLPGFDRNYKGLGIPYFYLTLNLKSIQVTAGDLYEQFGSGLIFRSYYERSLGVDNALRGGRINIQPAHWLELKMVGGKQRYYWSRGKSLIAGADALFNLNRVSQKLEDSEHKLQIGGSWVSKWEPRQDILVSPTAKLRLPGAVAAFATRMQYMYKGFEWNTEYAYKINDPSSENQYIYRPGQVLVLTSSYSCPGFSIMLGAKHTDNMQFRSDRTATGRMLQINYLPAFTRQQSYTLANMYPYATQPQGEVAFQADLFYRIKKQTFLGGKYGTDVRLNYSHITSLDKDYRQEKAEAARGTYGYDTHFFALGKNTYYRDFNMDISHRFTRSTKCQFTYMNLLYNQLQIEGHAENGDKVKANVFVLEGSHRLSRQVSLRTELQYLSTSQDKGDWMAALLELSVTSRWIFTITELYNCGLTHKNYILATVAYNTGAHRLQLSAGQQRAGITCAGGICRYVPATNGISLSYSMNFNL